MAVQGSPQDLKIFSSVRPLQIQRSFEGPAEATDIVEAVTRDVTIEKRSSFTITSQTSSSTSMSTIHSAADGVPTSPLSIGPATVIIKAASATTPTSPGTVLIRSSGVGSTSPGVGSQNVVILRSPSGPAPQQLVSSGQGAIVIKSAATTPPVVNATVIQPNAQSRIVISPAPITQSRITITGGAASPVQTAPPQAAETEVVRNETQANQAPPPPPTARRSSLTIKTAPTSPTPVTVAPLVNSPASIQPQSVAVNDGPPSNHLNAAEHAPQGVAVAEHRTPEPTAHPPTAAPVTAKEDLSEKIHQKKPAGPSLEELLDKFDISKVFYTALAVLVTAVACILAEGEVPLSWILAAIAVISLGAFIALRL